MRKRYIYCKQCKAVNATHFPVGYRAAGIETCPDCGSRNIDINLRKP